MFHKCFKSVSKVFQKCFENDSKVFVSVSVLKLFVCLEVIAATQALGGLVPILPNLGYFTKGKVQGVHFRT